MYTISLWIFWFVLLCSCPSLTGTTCLDLVYFLPSWAIKGSRSPPLCYFFHLRLEIPVETMVLLTLVFLHSLFCFFSFCHLPLATFLFPMATFLILHHTVGFDVFPAIHSLQFKLHLCYFCSLHIPIFCCSFLLCFGHIFLENRWLCTAKVLCTGHYRLDLFELLTSLSCSCYQDFLRKKLATGGTLLSGNKQFCIWISAMFSF